MVSLALYTVLAVVVETVLKKNSTRLGLCTIIQQLFIAYWNQLIVFIWQSNIYYNSVIYFDKCFQ